MTDVTRIHLKTISLHEIRLDGGTQSRVHIDPQTVTDYANHFASGGNMPPPLVFKDTAGAMWLADGFHRWHAAHRASLTRLECQVKAGDRLDALRHSLGANATHGLRRTNADKRRAIALALEHEAQLAAKESKASLSNREIARMCAVDEKTIRNHREAMCGTSADAMKCVTRGDTSYLMNTAAIGANSIETPEIPSRSAERVATVPDRVTSPLPSAAFAPPPTPLIVETPAKVLHSSASNEWYTPSRYVEAARALMGGIDLDPASCAQANDTVNAARYFTREDEGFERPWSGRVWMNPPFGLEDGQSNQGRWTSRLIERYEAGEVTEAVFLTNATTDRSWFKAFWRHAICFVDKRIAFFSPTGQKMQPTHGNVLVYLGEEQQRFVRLFGVFGEIVIPGSEYNVRVTV